MGFYGRRLDCLMWGLRNRVPFYGIDPGGHLSNAIRHSILTLSVKGGGFY